VIYIGNKFNDNTVKYQLNLSIVVDGVVSESDTIGALFGQTEGLLENELELKQLQKSGRIGRIDFKMKTKDGKSKGTISIPSTLNKINTAILAATLETVERVGPCDCQIRLDKIVDVRSAKRDQIKKRASEIMKMWNIETESDTKDISKFVEKDVTKGKIVVFGPDKLHAGPEIFKSHEIIIVEGRADISNLLNYGIENTIALDGTKVPSTIKNLSKNRNVTAFLDGDKGGDMILKELVQTTEIDFVARAPFRKEVEELSHKQILTALEKKVPVKKARFVTENKTVIDFVKRDDVDTRTSKRYTDEIDSSQRESESRDDRRSRDDREPKSDRGSSRTRRDGRAGRHRDDKSKRRGDTRDRKKYHVEVPSAIKEMISKIKQTSTVLFLNGKNEPVLTTKTTEAFNELQKAEGVESIVIDGVITQRMLDMANEKSVKLIAGAVIGNLTNKPRKPEIATFNRIDRQ
jgi:DNA primase